MPHIQADAIRRSLDRNAIELAIQSDLSDPFRDETRKAKRNLIASSFVAILLASLELQINSLGGVSAASGQLRAEIARGLACFVVLYFFVGYAVDALLDYAGWRIESKKLRIQPYLVLVRTIERSYRAAVDTLTTANDRVAVVASRASTAVGIDDAVNAVKITAAQATERFRELQPLLAAWQTSLRSLRFEFTVRRCARITRLWLWEIGIPLGLSALAVAKTYDGVRPVLIAIFSVPGT